MTAPGLEVNCSSKGDEHEGQGEVSKALHGRQYAERRARTTGWLGEEEDERSAVPEMWGEDTQKRLNYCLQCSM